MQRTATQTNVSTPEGSYPVAFRQEGTSWIASWSDPEIGLYEVAAPTKAEAARKAHRQQHDTSLLLTIERWMGVLKAKGLLPEAIDQRLTDALFTA
jgi:hypothetical protein